MVEPYDIRTFHFGHPKEEVVILSLRLPQWSLRVHVNGLVLRVGAVLGRADVDAEVAACAILGCYLDGEEFPLVLVSFIGRRLEGERGSSQRVRLVNLGADGGVRAHQRALIALD